MSATAVDGRVRDAWEGYRIACADVSASDYAETEMIAWELLQHELREISGSGADAVSETPES